MLLKVAAGSPDWHIARRPALVVLNTTMRTCEIRDLPWRDVDLTDSPLTIRRSNPEAVEHSVPLKAAVRAAILKFRERANLQRAMEPQMNWQTFPHEEGRGPIA